jgi:hypothetical protein
MIQGQIRPSCGRVGHVACYSHDHALSPCQVGEVASSTLPAPMHRAAGPSVEGEEPVQRVAWEDHRERWTVARAGLAVVGTANNAEQVSRCTSGRAHVRQAGAESSRREDDG